MYCLAAQGRQGIEVLVSGCTSVLTMHCLTVMRYIEVPTLLQYTYTCYESFAHIDRAVFWCEIELTTSQMACIRHNNVCFRNYCSIDVIVDALKKAGRI